MQKRKRPRKFRWRADAWDHAHVADCPKSEAKEKQEAEFPHGHGENPGGGPGGQEDV